MRILLTGGTGFIGKPLKHELVALGHELFVLTRLSRENKERINYIQWDIKNPPDLTELVNQIDIVINLAGEPIADKIWTREQKEKIRLSRILPTRILASAINNATKKPKKFISASAIGIYGNTGNEKITEKSRFGEDFLATVCKDWETEAQKADTNVVILRIGLVLGKHGGVLKKMLPPFKMFIGGPLGSGNQWMSWVLREDLISAIKFATTNDKVAGILNVTSPNPVTNTEFSNTLGKVIHRPAFMPVPSFALKLLFGEMADIMLGGQRVLPERLKEYGFEFKYPELEGVLKRILKE
jgi:hypothetical protein